jgi:hypothetical protein
MRRQHAVPQQTKILNRQETGFVRPILKQLATGKRLLQPFRRIGPQAAEQHQIRAAGDDANGIDL